MPASQVPPIAVTPADGCNLSLVQSDAQDRMVVTLVPPVHNWFAGTFTHLPLSRPVVLELPMQGNATSGNPADVRKWQGLVPVITYADPALYESYEWFAKGARGVWLSGDPCKTGNARKAGSGAVPIQQVIPATLARQFLTADGRYWIPWREVDGAEALPVQNVFRITHAYQAPTATVAMRVPFTYTYLQAWIARLRALKLPGVAVDEIGRTPANRALQVIRVDAAGTVATPATKTILIIAREHATEHATSWALMGAVNALVQDTREARALRKNTTWLFIPIEDPDGSASSTFDRLTNKFILSREEYGAFPEVAAYARYFCDYVYGGRSIDVVVSLHNVEARESEHVVCPMVNASNASMVLEVNRQYFSLLRQHGFRTGDPAKPWDYGAIPHRLFGRCADYFGALDLTYEVNDRYPAQRLPLPQLQELGAMLARTLSTWTASSQGQGLLARTRQIAKLLRLERDVSEQHIEYPASRQSAADRFITGY